MKSAPLRNMYSSLLSHTIESPLGLAHSSSHPLERPGEGPPCSSSRPLLRTCLQTLTDGFPGTFWISTHTPCEGAHFSLKTPGFSPPPGAKPVPRVLDLGVAGVT